MNETTGSVHTQKIEKGTSDIYNNLFTAYSPKLFEESVDLFFKRHNAWSLDLGFTPEWFRGKTCLDAGCGGGRFVVAMAKLGAARVEGIDISEEALKVARERAKERGLSATTNFTSASVLNIPFPDKTFDYVISSGVILLTEDPYKAFTELDRVLKPGGKMFLSVYGKGGLKWFVNDVFRYTVCQIIPFAVMEKLFALFGVPANKRYNTLDNLYTPYTKRFTEEEVREWFRKHGYWNLHRVKFERYDYSTILSRLIHGEGWIQIYGDKKQS
jgi:ubiquinone/menaquinone biosynthesis C-methylase UbiE